jgi:ATP-dependent Lhr-like helicase
MAVPVLIMIGREMAPAGTAEDELLVQAEALAEAAMRRE